MAVYDFDRVPNVRTPDSLKWTQYCEKILPMWVADMDFSLADPILQALHQRLDQGILGYPVAPGALRDVVCEQMKRCYGWDVQPDEILFLPGLETGLSLVCRVVGQPGDGVLVQTPIYHPFLSIPPHSGKFLQTVDLTYIDEQDGHIRYEFDADAFEEAITNQTSLLLFCNPHNPSGHVFTKAELEKVARICLKHRMLICSDEIHSNLLFDRHVHIPIASLSAEISQNTITLLAPSKTYNIAGLRCAMAIIQNPELRKQIERAAKHPQLPINPLGYTAALAAYQDGQEWLSQVLAYLQGNRDYLVSTLHQYLPMLKTTVPEATYLVWLDCSSLKLESTTYRLFLDKGQIALSNGLLFGGKRGKDFVRLNFACPRSTLIEGIKRMQTAVESHGLNSQDRSHE